MACRIFDDLNELISAEPTGNYTKNRPRRMCEDCVKADLEGLGLDASMYIVIVGRIEPSFILL